MRRIRVLTFLICIAVVPLASTASAQPPDYDPAAKREAIAELDFLVGEWRGQGWIARGPDHRQLFKSWELVRPKAGGTALLVEGRHTRGEGENEEVILEALGVISWDGAADRYRFSSYVSDGRSGDSPAKLTGGTFVWSPEIPGEGQVRYTIRIDKRGQWFEVGQYSTDGVNWSQFFEMLLKRVDDEEAESEGG